MQNHLGNYNKAGAEVNEARDAEGRRERKHLRGRRDEYEH